MKAPSHHYRQDEAGQWWYHERRGRRTRATIRACELCGDEYVVCVYHVKKSRFCSHLCSGRHVGRMRFGGNREENLELWTGSHPNGVREGQHCPTCTCGQHDAVTLKGTVAA